MRVEGMPMVSGTKNENERKFTSAPLSVVGQHAPFLLVLEPV